jgi:hypothetical protein
MRNTGWNSSRTPMGAVTYVQCDSGQIGWPNRTSWVHEESAGKASETVSDKASRQSDED